MHFSVSKLSQYSKKPTDQHWKALKQVIRYLAGTKDQGITYGTEKLGLKLSGWTDSNWAGDIDDSRLTSGYLFLLNRAVISWASKKQKSVALSTYEAEYMAQTLAVTEIVWLRGLLDKLDLLPTGPTIVNADNQAAIWLASNPDYHRRSKYIAVKYHYRREKIKDGTVELNYKPTADMLADSLTKALPLLRFQRFMGLLGLSTLRL